MINVTRPAYGITLNAGLRENLLDEQGNVMEFKDEQAASAYLTERGVSEDEMGIFEFPEVEES